MATQNVNFIAGLNGGYFWRVDIDGIWFDDVCREKLRFEANQQGLSLYNYLFLTFFICLII